MHLHWIVTPRNWGIAINVAWYTFSKEIAFQVGPFNLFISLGDE